MGNFHSSCLGGDSLRCSSQAPKTKASFTNDLLTPHCIPSLSTALFPFSLSLTSLSTEKAAHNTVTAPSADTPSTTHTRWVECVCFPAPHFPSPLRWWVGCKTDTEENKFAREILSCAGKQRRFTEIPWWSNELLCCLLPQLLTTGLKFSLTTALNPPLYSRAASALVIAAVMPAAIVCPKPLGSTAATSKRYGGNKNHHIKGEGKATKQ